MEYLNDRGSRVDLPIDELRDAMVRYYSGVALTEMGGDFHAEAEAEQRQTATSQETVRRLATRSDP